MYEAVGGRRVRGDVPAHDRARLVDAAGVGHVVGVADVEHDALGREARVDQVEVARLRAFARARTSALAAAGQAPPRRPCGPSTHATSSASQASPRAASTSAIAASGLGRDRIDALAVAGGERARP